MRFKETIPPREFEVGYDKKGIIKDCGRMELEPDEQITFITTDGGEYDVARKDWGFYATPSLNGRLQQFNLRAVLVKNRMSRYFVMLVEKGKEALFETYVRQEPLKIVCWMDSLDNLKHIDEKVTGA